MPIELEGSIGFTCRPEVGLFSLTGWGPWSFLGKAVFCRGAVLSVIAQSWERPPCRYLALFHKRMPVLGDFKSLPASEHTHSVSHLASAWLAKAAPSVKDHPVLSESSVASSPCLVPFPLMHSPSRGQSVKVTEGKWQNKPSLSLLF